MGRWQIYHWSLWTSHATTFPWQFDDFVAFYVLAGNAIVTPKGAWLLHRLLMLRAGDMVLLPRGFAGDWQCFPAITLRWIRGETPPDAFSTGLPQTLEDLAQYGLGQLGQPLPDPWAQPPTPPAVAHHTAAPDPDVASPSGPMPTFPVDSGPTYVCVPDCAPPLSGHGLDAEQGGGHPMPENVLASAGASRAPRTRAACPAHRAPPMAGSPSPMLRETYTIGTL